MQKTRRLHRLLAVLVAVLLAVCSLPVSAFAAQSTVSSHVYVTLKLDNEKKGEADFWLGDLPFTPGSRETKCTWKQLYDNLLKATTLPENTRIKDKHEEGECTLELKLQGNETYRSDVTLELEPEYEIEFTIRYVGSGGADLGSHKAKVLYSPSTAPEAWAYVSSAEEFKAFNAPLKELKIEQDGDKTYTEGDHLKIGPDLKDKTLVAYLDKSADPIEKKVEFTLRYLSTDNLIQDTQPASLIFRQDDPSTDVWNFVLAQDAYKNYEAQGYKLEDYVVSMDGADRQFMEPDHQAVNPDLQGKEIIVHLVKKTEAKAEQVPFRLHYLSIDGNISDDKNVEVPYDPNGKSYDLWSYIQDSRTYKAYQKEGYTLKNFVVPHLDSDKTYTAAGQFTVTPALKGTTVTVTLDKPVVSTKKTVEFTLQYKSNDGILDATKGVSAQYDPEGVLTDLWDYLKDTGTVKSANKSGYTLQNYVLDERTVSTHGVQAVNGDLAGKTIVVNLYKEPVSTSKTVDFTLRYLSTDNKIQDTRAATLTYEPEGVLTDAWDFLLAQDAYKEFEKQGYSLSDYVVLAEGGDRVCEHRGMQAVTTDLQGKTVIVHLVKKTEAKVEQVPFRLRFTSTDGTISETREAQVSYDPNGTGHDLWNFITDTGAYRNHQAAGYFLKSFEVPLPAGNMVYTEAGQFTVTPAMKGAIVTVLLDRKAEPASLEGSYRIHFVDEQGKEFLPGTTVTFRWKEGEQLNLMAQLKDTLATVNAQGYSCRTLTAWNSTEPYKGTEVVVPGSWELAARCAKNPVPPANPGAKPTPGQTKPAENKPTATAKPAENKPVATAQPAKAQLAPAKAVVKPAAPAAGSTKILPKTGLQTGTPVVFVVMLAAALAGAAAWLVILRKKLN